MQLQRKTLSSNTETIFEFNKLNFEFLVKNLTEGSILVCFGDTFIEEKSVKIPMMAFEVLSDCNKLIIKSETEGEVEVRCLK